MPHRISSRLTGLIAALFVVIGVAVAHGDTVELPVPKVTLYPGDAISGEALTMQVFAPGAERLPVVKTREAVEGKVARRTLLAGKPIPLNGIRNADVIQQGKSVRLVFSSGGLTITGTAIALQSGGPGSTLNLRSESGATIKGVVQPDGTVRVDGP